MVIETERVWYVRKSAAETNAVRTLLQTESAAKTLQTAAIQSTIAVIVAEETAMMAAVAASTAAAASAAND